ncbi:MAG: fumarylacetoacetase [Betaproteobacteria bacterium]|nr:fumarylacetoacetase [Betaproteobacteria bacterium]MBK7516003.1 fumarylacetoacetase [Betaproteobacteria bacterium]MBK8864938.1 fumarylacetoacetase [Betaproteobacteria bacterium]MBK9683669.1 fumarylacetoacetase [Betaproteobacteria bacterium]
MNRLIDATHDPALRSWVESANAPDSDFPVQNLPLGRFRLAGADEPLRCGVAIGDQVLDLQLALQLSPWPDGVPELLAPLAAGELAAFMALGRPAWKALRAALSAALAEGSDTAPFLELCLLPQAQAAMALPCRVGDYTDFYTGIHHALTVGKLMRPDHPLLPNYKWVPIGYHGRASSVTLGGPVTRPRGQTRSSGDTPHFGPSQRLDYELELGLWVGVGNELGTPVPMAQAEERLFGVTLLNDWSARDLQGWEYQPLGPFLAKNFSTMVSPWIVSFEALAPFRRPFTRPAGDPQPLPYLDSEFNREAGALDIRLEVWLQTARMRELGLPAQRLSHSNALDAYWTPAQLVAHHTSNGCNLATGDLLGTGTLSGPLPAQGGSLLELSAGGRQPLALPGGETRTFLEDGDTVTLRAFCAAPGAVRIGLGSVSGTVLPA